MTITILQESLQALLHHIQKAIPSKPTLPILSSVLLEVKKDVCIISATDLYFGVRASISVQSDEEGVVAIPGKQFKEIISALPPGKITMKYADGTLSITQGKMKCSLQCQTATDFPSFPAISGEPITLQKKLLDQIEGKVGFSASTDLARPVLTTIHCHFSPDFLRFVATDGFRLALFQLESSTQANGKDDEIYLIPAKALSEVLRIADSGDVEEISLQVSQELKQALFTLGQTQVYVRLIEGEYPPFERIIPTSFGTTVSFVTKELEDTIKRALIFAREASNIIKVNIMSDLVKISATSSSVGSFEAEVEQAVIQGPGGEIAFNARYILEYLQSIQSEQVVLSINESLKPAQLSTPDQPGYQYIIMPFKVSG